MGGEPREAAARSVRRVVLASFIGTTVEWYDFFLYGTAAALVFNRLFFPQLDPLTGTMAAFATYAVGFFARPLGGAIFGMALITLVSVYFAAETHRTDLSG